MSGGGGKDQTVTQVSGPPEWLRPYWEANVIGAQQLTQRPLQLYGGTGIAGFSPEQLAGQEMMINRALGGNQLVGQAESEIGRNISGQYLNANPYIDQSVNRALSRITDQYKTSTMPSTMAQFQRAGAFGGSAHQEALARQEQGLGQALGDTASQMYGANYAQERQNQLAALGMADRYGNADYQDAMALMQVGDLRQRQMQMLSDYDRAQYQQAWQHPYDQLNYMQGLIAGSPYQSQTGPNPNYTSPAQGALGGAMLGYGVGSAMGAGGGAAAGASQGSWAGPWGALIGAGLGYAMSR